MKFIQFVSIGAFSKVSKFGLVANNLNIIIPGTTPLVTISAKESNCFPNSPETFKILAANPSKKSKKIPKTTKIPAISKFP